MEKDEARDRDEWDRSALIVQSRTGKDLHPYRQKSGSGFSMGSLESAVNAVTSGD